MPTEKLFYSDSHLFSFDAVVTDCRERGSGYALILDRTAFFPEGGGQRADTGYIGSERITDVQEKNGEILHYCSSPLPVGESYRCVLDAEQRYRRMQNHSGEHIVSGITHRLHGFDNVGFHMGDDCMTIDFDGELSWDEVKEIETLSNETVRADLPIVAFFPDREALASIQYRSKKELAGDVRLVTIGDVDCCACCAPHVSRTGEVGVIKILEMMRHRGGVRIELVCGMDALDDYRRKQDSVTAVSQLLSVKRNEVAPAVERIIADSGKKSERIAALSMELVRLSSEGIEATDGNIIIFNELLDEVGQRELVNRLVPRCGGIAGVFCGSDGDGYRYVIGSRSGDLRKSSKQINSLIGGRGGGTSEMIMGRANMTSVIIREALARFRFSDNIC